MITMSNIGENGRLGNQLFQYAMLKSVSEKTGYKLVLPKLNNKVCHGQTSLLSNFTLSCDFVEKNDFSSFVNKFNEKDSCGYDESVFECSEFTDFNGLFINKNYFINYENEIKKDFNFIPEVFNYAKTYIENIKSKYSEDYEIVSVHIRRGDNSDSTNLIFMDYYGKNGVFEEDSHFGKYFNNAKKVFLNKKVIYLIFTGGNRNSDENVGDVNWCKENLKCENMIFSEGNSSIQDFAIMSMCNHNIISHQTTFSWWAAFLNRNKNKIVVAPKNWFYMQEERNYEGFYPKDFKLV